MLHGGGRSACWVFQVCPTPRFLKQRKSKGSPATEAQMVRILGLDPANKCGWAHDDGFGCEFGVWNLKGKTDRHPGRRLERFRRLLYTMKRELGIDAIAYEDASFGIQQREHSSQPQRTSRRNQVGRRRVGRPNRKLQTKPLKKMADRTRKSQQGRHDRSCGKSFCDHDN